MHPRGPVRQQILGRFERRPQGRRGGKAGRWLAQQGRVDEADRVMRAIEAQVAIECGGSLPAPEPPVVEDPRKGKLSEIFNPTYRSRTIMLSVAPPGRLESSKGTASLRSSSRIAAAFSSRSTLNDPMNTRLEVRSW